MVLVGFNKEKYVFTINFNHKTILLKRGVLVALNATSFLLVYQTQTFVSTVGRGRLKLQIIFS